MLLEDRWGAPRRAVRRLRRWLVADLRRYAVQPRLSAEARPPRWSDVWPDALVSAGVSLLVRYC
jgi:hypothetical protein